MSLTAISPRRTRFALEIDAEPPASGFRIVGAVSQPFLRTMPASWTAPLGPPFCKRSVGTARSCR